MTVTVKIVGITMPEKDRVKFSDIPHNCGFMCGPELFVRIGDNTAINLATYDKIPYVKDVDVYPRDIEIIVTVPTES